MWAVAHWLSAWHDWDWSFFNRVESPPPFSSDVALVDMHYADRSDVPKHREMLAAFIDRAAKQRPAAIVLDMAFGQCPVASCDRSWTASTQALIAALVSAKQYGVPVYANVGDIELTPDGLVDGPAGATLDQRIYANLAGYGHTAAVVLSQRDTQNSGDLFYYQCYPAYPSVFEGGTPQDVWALAYVVFHPDALTARSVTTCDPSVRVPVRYGPALNDSSPAEYQISDSQPFSSEMQLANRYVIVGVPAFDRHEQLTARSGLELLGWIFTDALDVGKLGNLQILPQGDALRAIVPAFSAIAVLAYAAFFLLLRRLALAGARRFLPWIAALAALVIGMLVFGAFEVWMLRGPHVLLPQVALVSIGVALASVLSGIRGEQIEFELRHQIDAKAAPEESDYDVFISYAHEELSWVLPNVYVPFQNARLADGRKLKIFFDTSAIGVGTAWQDKISLAIDGSRFVVPIYSETYFKKPYCRFEIKRAHRKWIHAGESSRCVFPIMRGHPAILHTVDDIQAKSIDDDPGLVDDVIAEIVARLSEKKVTA
jgi:hypothetical protein